MKSFQELKFRFRNVEEQLKGIYAYNSNRQKTSLDGPFSVQIQTIDQCNAACKMCPFSSLMKTGKPNVMDMGLFNKILMELSNARTVRLVALMLQNEPLLDPGIAQRIHQVKMILGNNVHTAVVTNGALLTPNKIQKLISSGIDSIEVSVDAYYEGTYNMIRPGISFKKVDKNIKTLLKYNNDIRIVIRFLKQSGNKGEEQLFRQYWESKRAKVKIFPLVNRAGALDSYQQIKNNSNGIPQKLKRSIWKMILCSASRSFSALPCTLPFTWLNVLWDGRVILCCHDWGPIETVGNLADQNLSEVWNSKTMNYHRQALWNDEYEKSLICRNCSIAKRDQN